MSQSFSQVLGIPCVDYALFLFILTGPLLHQARPGIGSNSKPLPNNALVGGAEANGTPLYIGRATYKVFTLLHLHLLY